MSAYPDHCLTLDQVITKLRSVFADPDLRVERVAINFVGPQGGRLKYQWDRRKVQPVPQPDQLRWLIVGTATQFAKFCKAHHLTEAQAHRVRSENDVRGWRPTTPLLVLPGCQLTPALVRAVATWRAVGEVVYLSGNDLHAGQVPCPNDTNGDGDCHLCRGPHGCQWGKPQALKP